MSNSKDVWRRIDDKAPAYFGLSDRIWHMPELNYQEVRSAAEHGAMLHTAKITTLGERAEDVFLISGGGLHQSNRRILLESALMERLKV